MSAARETGPKIAELNQKIGQQEADKQSLMQKIKDALAEKLAYQQRMQEQEENLKKVVSENQAIKVKIIDSEAVLKRQQTTIETQSKVQLANEQLRESVRLHQE